LRNGLLAVVLSFPLVVLGYFLVPYAAGDFALRSLRFLEPLGRLLIFPLLLWDSKWGMLGSVLFDAILVFAIAEAISHYESNRTGPTRLDLN
jgi:hypothetical protein